MVVEAANGKHLQHHNSMHFRKASQEHAMANGQGLPNDSFADLHVVAHAGGTPTHSCDSTPRAGSHQDDVPPEKLQQLRQSLHHQHRHNVDEATLRRFYKATGGNIAQSTKRLQATCQWRDSYKPEQVVCKACAKDPRSHYMHLVGHDMLDRPIIYSCLALATNRVYQDNVDHMIQTFETAIKCMPPGVENWVWVCDFHGFGMSDVNPKLAKAFLDVSATHYPERLGLFILLDTPTLFSALWRAIQAFVDPKTHAKIRFLPYDVKSSHSKLAAELDRVCDPTTKDWLLKEITENRDAKKMSMKRYNVVDIHRSASSGKLLAKGEGAELDLDHDNRGTPNLLRMYSQAPGLLEPQALVTAP